jgi:hypothetical protein
VASDRGELAAIGQKVATHLPEVGSNIEGEFSPDSTHFAYTPTDSGKVVVYDLASGAYQVVLQTPCQKYSTDPSPAPGIGRTVCGGATVNWIDPNTLFVWHFAGAMPQELKCDINSAAPCGIGPNTYSVVAAGGGVLATVPGATAPVQARGQTVLLGDGQWLDVGELRAGTTAPKAQPKGTVVPCLSPDGLRVAVADHPWRLVEVRTGTVTRLGTRKAIPEPAHAFCAWSPDGKFLAVQAPGFEKSVLVVPASRRAGGVAGSTDGQLKAWAP